MIQASSADSLAAREPAGEGQPSLVVMPPRHPSASSSSRWRTVAAWKVATIVLLGLLSLLATSPPVALRGVHTLYGADTGLVRTAETVAGPFQGVQDPCAFEYPGPLRIESMDCFMEYFPAKIPFYQPMMPANRSFTLGGIHWEGGPLPVPIFVLFKDRVSVLMESLRSFWRHIGTPYELIIFNDNTTYPAAVRFLDPSAVRGDEEYAQSLKLLDEMARNSDRWKADGLSDLHYTTVEHKVNLTCPGFSSLHHLKCVP